MAAAVPYAAQQKVLRLARDALRRTPRKPKLIDQVEALAGFDGYGDLTSHLGVRWPHGREDGIDLTRTAMDGEVVGLLQAFTRQMQARGVTVIVSYTSAIADYYERHRASIDSLHRLLTESPPLVVPSPPNAFVFPEAGVLRHRLSRERAGAGAAHREADRRPQGDTQMNEQQIMGEIQKIIGGLLGAKGLVALKIDAGTELIGGGLEIDSLDLASLVRELEDVTGYDPFKDGFIEFRTAGELAKLYQR